MTMNSKKLSGNGLWESSRMMLPQHREALVERRQQPQEKHQVPTMEELVLIRNASVLPMLLTIVEKNMRQIEVRDLSLKELYIRASKVFIDRVIRDISDTKKLLRGQGIKIGEDEKVDDMIRVKFNCRGYEDDIVITRDMVKSEISIKIKVYIDDVFKPLLKK